jgi:hypothetical protein
VFEVVHQVEAELLSLVVPTLVARRRPLGILLFVLVQMVLPQLALPVP